MVLDEEQDFFDALYRISGSGDCPEAAAATGDGETGTVTVGAFTFMVDVPM